MKKLYLLLLLGIPFFIYSAGFKPEIIQTSQGYKYIKLVTSTPWCGALHIKARGGYGPITLKSYRLKSDSDTPQRPIGSDTLQPGASQLYRYDWAGPGDTHYRIYCFTQDGKPINCDAAIEMNSYKHDAWCIDSPALGTYKGLSMNLG